ncbi:hypothetical protein SO802_029482 [Lithocarpus litseifolius]|uniref:Uncharacterized protein n=1 Tax=Lithocarpus litseifolius TaxID=425828 RepID=A0AAW2BUA6_9ROSI
MAALFTKFHAFFLFLLLSFALQVVSGEDSQCVTESTHGCHDKSKALKLNLIAIAAILIFSMIGVCLPLFTQSFPALNPDSKSFSIIKAFASGVILATGYMHVLPDSFACLQSDCLPHHPWKKFPFSTFVAMLSALLTLMLDSLAMSYHTAKPKAHAHFGSSSDLKKEAATTELHTTAGNGELVLEVGIVVHSVVIGLSLGASHNPCMIRPLIMAMCFHQLFEGMGLGGCILQADYKLKMNMIMVFFFSITTPFGIALGLCLSNIYSENSPIALIVVGVLDAASAGILNYMALVNLLAVDFMGSKLQQNVTLQMLAFLAVLLGAGGMSLLAKWA